MTSWNVTPRRYSEGTTWLPSGCAHACEGPSAARSMFYSVLFGSFHSGLTWGFVRCSFYSCSIRGGQGLGRRAIGRRGRGL